MRSIATPEGGPASARTARAPIASLITRWEQSRRWRAAYLRLWTSRLLLWGGAVCVGLLAVLFAEMAEGAVRGFHTLYDRFWWWPLFIGPAGGALVVWATRRWFRGAEGSGIPQAIVEIHHTKPPAGHAPLLSLRIAFGKIVLGAAALFAGFSAGREGPTVQVGAAVMNSLDGLLHRSLNIQRRHLIAAGGAAGIAAAFNAPIAGIMFAIEELNHGLEQRMSGLLIVAIVISGVVSQAFFGAGAYFGWVSYTGLKSNLQMVWVVAIALVCGLSGGIFARLMLAVSAREGPFFNRYRSLHPIRYAAVCGLLIALIGYLSDFSSIGTGYTETRNLLEHDAQLPWHFGLDKFFATLISYASGIPGGIFAPSLAIGAGIGNNIAGLLAEQLHSGTVLVLCAAGFLAAVTQAPITAFVIVMEMVSGYGIVIDLMLTALLASAVSRALCPPLYHTLAQRMMSAPRDG
ncbi:chloride channel protein [Sulfuricystis thermophila]|uniref:chloride channel protein n=1 Tax=Sulfuricystis thermophila TaxID=2496847 RepID=UPI0010358785|nr:chloride channel protein [Sulfuricystis thermophila]